MEKSLENYEIGDYPFSGDLQTQVRESITNGRNICLTTYVITPQTEEFLKAVLDAIFDAFAVPDLKMTGYIILKELTTNAVKANLKHFLRITKPAAVSDEAAFMAEFRKILSSGGALPYRDALKKAGLKIDVVFAFQAQGIVLSVSNSFAIAGDEKNRLLEKLNQATAGGDMRKFFEKNKQDAEGAGLGFTMVFNSLKSAGIDPGALTFDTSSDKATTARIMIPVAGRETRGKNG